MVTCRLANITIESTIVWCLWLVGAMTAVLLLLTFVPEGRAVRAAHAGLPCRPQAAGSRPATWANFLICREFLAVAGFDSPAANTVKSRFSRRINGSSTRARFVAGNWKMNGSLAANAELLKAVSSGLAGLRGVECAVCVPFPYLQQAGAALGESALKLGAQTLSEHALGAYTGEVSAAMLVEFGCRYVLVGHSERRALFGETDAQVAAKFLAAAKAGLVPLLCVGESLQERESGQTEQVVGRQLDAVMDAAGVQALEGAVLAYEPVWAIGTGRTASPQQAQDVHAFLRARVAARDAKVAAQCGESLRGQRQGLQCGGDIRDGGCRWWADRRCIAGGERFSGDSQRSSQGVM